MERETNPLPESVVQEQVNSSLTKEETPLVPRVLPQTQAFLNDVINTEAYQELDERTRELISIYFGTDTTLEKLMGIARVSSRERVRQIIIAGMKKLWQDLPPSLKEQHQKERVIQLKKSEARKGKKHTPETRAKMSEAHKGRLSPMKGRRHTPETRAKISEAHKGKKHTPETRAKISEALKGRLSPMKGRRHTPETRAKMSEAHKTQWAKRKKNKG